MTRSHTADTNHDRLAVQSERELLSSQDPSVLLFSSVTPPANAICLFLKSELQDVLPARVLFLGGLHNQGPASRSLLLLADCCLQPNPTAWRNVKYSLLNCRAGVGLEPYQAFTADEYYTPNFKHGETKSTSRSRIRGAFCHLPATNSISNSSTPESCLIKALRLSSLSLRRKAFVCTCVQTMHMCALFALQGIYRREKGDCLLKHAFRHLQNIFFFSFTAPILHWQRSLLLGLAGLLTQPAGSAAQASPPLLQLPARSQGASQPASQPAYSTEHLLVKDAEG